MGCVWITEVRLPQASVTAAPTLRERLLEWTVSPFDGW